jgi:hypothetical protein
MLGEEIAHERAVRHDLKPARARGFQRAGDQPRREAVAARLRRYLRMRERDRVAGEPVVGTARMPSSSISNRESSRSSCRVAGIGFLSAMPKACRWQAAQG